MIALLLRILAVVASAWSSPTEVAPRKHAADDGPEGRAAMIHPNDPRMLAARDEARDRFGEFEAKFRERSKYAAFAVKYGFPLKDDPSNREHMWVEVTAIEDGKVRGVLANAPIDDVGHAINDAVSLPAHEITDWIVITLEGRMIGGFQEKVVKAIVEEKSR